MPASSAGGYDKARAATAASNKGGLGGFTSFKDMFDGGGPGKSRPSSEPTAANRPQARPEVLKSGTGKDTRYMDTKTGKSYATPEYSPLSFRGLTSTDPANVARNRYGAERMNAMPVNTSDRGSDRSGIASLQPPEPTPTPPTPQELAQIGAPTTPMAPIFVDSPIYGMPGQTMFGQPMPNQTMPGYGSAFSGLSTVPQFSMMDLIDLFGPSMNFGR